MSSRPCLQPFPPLSRHNPFISPLLFRPFTCHAPLPGVGLIIPHSSFLHLSLHFLPCDSDTHTPVTQRDNSQPFIHPPFSSSPSSLFYIFVHSHTTLFFPLLHKLTRTNCLFPNFSFPVLVALFLSVSDVAPVLSVGSLSFSPSPSHFQLSVNKSLRLFLCVRVPRTQTCT